MLSLLAGAAFLTKMCYLSLAFNTIFVIVFLDALLLVRARASRHSYSRSAVGVWCSWRCKLTHSETSFACTAQQFGPMQYDEFSHMAVQVLVSPMIVWLVHQLLSSTAIDCRSSSLRSLPERSCSVCRLLTRSSSCGTRFILAVKRIWGPYDTATDLQWDLCGIIVGTLFSCIMLRDTRDQLVPH